MLNEINFLNINSKYKTEIIDRIDNMHYLDLQNGETSRLDLFLYALALGKNNPTELEKKDSFVRGEYIEKNPEAIAMIIALAFAKKKDYESLEQVFEEKHMGDLSDMCANTGFKTIATNLDSYIGENSYLEMIEDLDDLYEEYVKQQE